MRWRRLMCAVLGHHYRWQVVGPGIYFVCRRCAATMQGRNPYAPDYPEGMSQQSASDGSHSHAGQEQRSGERKGAGGAG
jgi:hypothetical protein